MKWELIPAEDFCASVRDGTHDTPKPVEYGYKLITGKHIKNGCIDSTDAYYISLEDYTKINERSLVEQWDVLMSMIGTVGEVALVKQTPDYAIKNLALFKCGHLELKGKWLSYYLQSPMAKGHMSGNQKGSSQQFLSLKQLRELPIPVTEVQYMQRVVDYLSAYDDLIENNQKQIKLLEEAAQRLYKEWYIDLRFPGHENTPIHDGVPEGWEKCELQQVAKVNENTIAKNYSYEYIDYVDLSSVTAGKIKEKTRYEKTEAPGRAKRIAKDGDIIWGMVRPNLRSYALVMHPTETEVFSTGFCILSAKLVPFSYLYCVVTQPSFVSYLVKCTNGAAYPAVRPEHFEKAVIEKPHKKVLSFFNCIAEPIFREMELLQIQNKQLAEARDRLLPKLMSGEIEV